LSITLPRIYPITDPRISGISHLEQVERLIDGGAQIIQLREKHASPREFYEIAKQVVDLASAYHVPIIINDRVDIALAVGATGVHLGQDDMPPNMARKVLGKHAVIGYSTHSVEQAIEAATLPIDYIAFGPIFPTQTKEDPDAVVGLDGLSEVRASIGNIPLVAIGGIDENDVPAVLAAGADSVAMISSILHEPENITETTRRLTSL
jgi:thiamine-phosphate pyrophosphorylase